MMVYQNTNLMGFHLQQSVLMSEPLDQLNGDL